MNSLSVLDLIVIVVILSGLVRGFRQGFLPVFIESVGVIGGALVAINYYSYLTVQLMTWFPLSNSVAVFIAFLGIWGVIYAISRLISQLIKPLLSLTLLRPIDRFVGSFLGAARSFCVLLPLLIPMSYSELAIYHESKIAKPLNALVYQHLPTIQETSTVLNQKMEAKKLKKNTKKLKKKANSELERLKKALESNNINEINDLLE